MTYLRTSPLDISPRVRGPRLWAAALLALAGLVLVALGGCFLLGALIILRPEVASGTPPMPPTTLSPALSPLLMTLQIAGWLCLLGAIPLIALGARGLLRVLEEKPSST